MTVVRRIRTLRLRAPTDALVRRGAALVEDALRTASIPDADGGRVYVIRRLLLPPVRATASANALALALERRLASLRSGAVHASDPRAASADVVYFDDDADVQASLIRALVHDAASAWFWRCVEPAKGAQPDPAGRMRTALLLLSGSRAGAVSVARLLTVAVEEGWSDAVLSSVLPADGPELLCAVAPGGELVAPARPAPPPAASPLTDSRAETRWAGVLRVWAARWGWDDARATWLANVATLSSSPSLGAAPSRLALRARALLDRARTEPADRPFRSRLPPRPSMAPHAPARGRAEAPRMEAPSAPAFAPLHGALPDRTQSFTAHPSEERWTRAGGLLFVAQLLRRLDFDAFLETHADTVEERLGETILRAIARRVRTPADDALLDALAAADDERDPPAESPLARFWITAVRRWCRRTARIGLHTLVRRPALIAHSPTHIDLTFDLRTADVRLRRAGLDLDPGWVPWLGRVVLFHYTRGPWP
jgi:hypothetical protein